MAMTSWTAKVLAAGLVCLAGAELLGSTKTQAEILQVDLVGTFTNGTPSDSPVPFSGSFDVDTSVTPIEHLTSQGLSVTGYPDAAISNVSVSAFGDSFSAAEITDRMLVAGAPGSAVYFSEDLHPGATPSIAMQFRDGASTLDIGDIICGATCSFTNLLAFEGPSIFDATGTVAVSVSAVPEPSTWAMLLLGFAGLGFAGYRHTRTNRVASAAN